MQDELSFVTLVHAHQATNVDPFETLFRGVGSRSHLKLVKGVKVCNPFSSPITPDISAPTRNGFAKYKSFSAMAVNDQNQYCPP